MPRGSHAAHTPDEIVVIGRQPGPPLCACWTAIASSGSFRSLRRAQGHGLGVDKVAAVIAQAEEMIELPNIGADVSPRLYLNRSTSPRDAAREEAEP